MALVGRVLTVECPCAGTPHEADTITFRPVMPLAGGVAGMAAIAAGAQALGANFSSIQLAEYVFPVYLAHAIEAWTFTGADGAPVPLTDGDAVLPFGVKYAIADAADDLFGEEISRPLVAMISRSYPSGPTASSTSPNRSSGRRRRPRSAPSSPATSGATGP